MTVIEVEELAQEMALALLAALEDSTVDVVNVQANVTGGMRSVSWHGFTKGTTSFHMHLIEEEIPDEA